MKNFFLFALTLSAQPSLEPGTLPTSWITGGPNCLEIPDWQIHQYNPTFFILRESGCTNYEKPFLYLILGKDRALLVDTGAGPVDTAVAVKRLTKLPLTVVHSHGHGDHVAGDKSFTTATLIPATVDAEQKAFGIATWPDQPGSIDLGDRIVDVLAIPGHQPAHVAYYDRKTGILLTGDHLYPGRLYVADFPAYVSSTRRLVQFTESHPIAHILGCHIEQTSTPYVDYPTGTKYQPQEHTLELGRAHLLELMSALEALNGIPAKVFLRDLTIYPVPPRK